MNEISNSIKTLRKENHLSQDQLAEKLYVTRQAVSNWENGKNQPYLETLKRIAEVFDVSVERLLYGKKKRKLHFVVKFMPEQTISLGSILAVVISYAKWQSIGWAILHGMLNWFYVIYYIIKY